MAEPICVARVLPNLSTTILIAFEQIKTFGSAGVSNVSADKLLVAEPGFTGERGDSILSNYLHSNQIFNTIML